MQTYICKKEFNTDKNDKNAFKVKSIVIIPENVEELLIVFAI